MELNKDYMKVDLTELQPNEIGFRQIAYLLRHPEEWPKNHHWNFCTISGAGIPDDERPECGTVGCAIGLARLKWSREAAWTFESSNYGVTNQLFYNDAIYKSSMEDVTPTMVADAIDHYLITGQVGDDR